MTKCSCHSAAERIVGAARSYLRVPWKHQGEDRAGMDCVGLLIAVARDLGLAAPLSLAHAELPALELFEALLPEYCERIARPQPGAVLRLRTAGRPQHLGLMATRHGYPTLIHAYATEGCVCEHRLDRKWQRRIVSAWRLKGLSI